MSVNKITLLGYVGRDPEVKRLESGVSVASLTLATTEKGYTLQNGTQVPERTEWHNLVLWKGFADTAEKYIKKGDKLYVDGKIRTRSYDDSNGVKRYVTEVYVENMELLGTKREERHSTATSSSNTKHARKDENLHRWKDNGTLY